MQTDEQILSGIVNGIGVRFGVWQILGFYAAARGTEDWYCLCDCGEERLVSIVTLSSEYVQQCRHRRIRREIFP